MKLMTLMAVLTSVMSGTQIKISQFGDFIKRRHVFIAFCKEQSEGCRKKLEKFRKHWRELDRKYSEKFLSVLLFDPTLEELKENVAQSMSADYEAQVLFVYRNFEKPLKVLELKDQYLSSERKWLAGIVMNNLNSIKKTEEEKERELEIKEIEKLSKKIDKEKKKKKNKKDSFSDREMEVLNDFIEIKKKHNTKINIHHKKPLQDLKNIPEREPKESENDIYFGKE